MGLGSLMEFMVQAGDKAGLALVGGRAGFDPRRRCLYIHFSVWGVGVISRTPMDTKTQGCSISLYRRA